ncbi:MAG TPA: hypothetical protein VL977_03140, partial [Solirubrobacteraceae bacterium]|nr:hypothetical protein [Solirubrobacteraceae bacterium]
MSSRLGSSPRVARRAGASALAALALCPALASASATLTSPAAGGAVALDPIGLPTFTWSMPSDEVGASVLVVPGSEASSPPSLADPFDPICTTAPDAAGNYQRQTSCTGNEALPAGPYDA